MEQQAASPALTALMIQEVEYGRTRNLDFLLAFGGVQILSKMSGTSRNTTVFKEMVKILQNMASKEQQRRIRTK